MERNSLYFTAPGQIAIREETLLPTGRGQVLVESICSAISPGTESLIYHGQFPTGMAVDEGISALSGEFSYPLKYGYALVGRVIQVGAEVDPDWQERLVFAFNPHESHFIASPDELMPVPEGMAPEEAVFLPNMETAINFVMDGAPLIGEKVVIFGQGIVGLLTTTLLARFPLDDLITLDRYPLRRQTSLACGAQASLDPAAPQILDALKTRLSIGSDLTYELSGSPVGLDQALAVTGFAGRLVIGSWYGKKKVDLDLGGYFHRSRIRLISSQVTSLAPELSGRWTKGRRFEIAWQMLSAVKPSAFITQRFPLKQAAQAYELLDQCPQDAIQVLLTY